MTTITITVNGKQRSVHPTGRTAVDLLRTDLGLTGTKLSCEVGLCGACTIWLDGKPTISCLLPVEHLDNREITTIEGVNTHPITSPSFFGPKDPSCTQPTEPEASQTPSAANLADTEVGTSQTEANLSDLHPVQRAFVAHDAIQCGFCIPGFVMAAIGFYNQHRQLHGTATPDREQIKKALTGKLCRCGTTPAIIRALQAACAGQFDQPPTVPSAPERVDAITKVTGQARYTVDILPVCRLEQMLAGVILRSSHPHADIRYVDLSKLSQAPEVRGYADLLGKDRRVRYRGQPIGVVIATTQKAATTASKLIDVGYSPLPAAIGMTEAHRPDAPNTHLRPWSIPTNNEARPAPAMFRGNNRGPQLAFSHRPLKAHRLLKDAAQTNSSGSMNSPPTEPPAQDRTYPSLYPHPTPISVNPNPLFFSHSFYTPAQTHATAEPHAAIAQWEDQHLTVWASTQSLSSLSRKLKKRFGADQVTVRSQYVGGAFGAKQGLTDEIVAAVEAARVAGVPVRVVLSQNEELSYTGYRPATRQDLSLLSDSASQLRALGVTAYADGGASAGQTTAGLLRLTYPGAPMKLLDFDVVSNAPPAKPFRAPGFPQALLSLEQSIDVLAVANGEDPLALRRRWSNRPLRQAIYDRVGELSWWKDRPAFGGQNGHIVRGVGLACGTWYYGFDPRVKVTVSTQDGKLVAASGLQDMGQGAYTVLANSVAAVFGVSPHAIELQVGSSDFGRGPTSSASRTSTSIFPTAQAAATQLQDKLVEEAAVMLGEGEIKKVPGGITHREERISWSELLPRLSNHRMTASRPTDSHFPITPFPVQGVQVGWRLSDVAHVVEVEVDQRYGQVRVLRVHAVMAAGKIFAPQLAKGQVEGAVMQGIGLALCEERRTDPRSGLVLTADGGSYRYLGAGETPEISIEFIEEGFEHAGGGGSGIAELAITSVPAATANAVAAAIGKHINVFPLRSDRVLAAQKWV